MKAHDFSCNTQRGPLRSREVTTKLEDTYKSKYCSVRIGKKNICIELFISLIKKKTVLPESTTIFSYYFKRIVNEVKDRLC